MKQIAFIALLLFSPLLSALECETLVGSTDCDHIIWCNDTKVVDISGVMEISGRDIDGATIRARRIVIRPDVKITETILIAR